MNVIIAGTKKDIPEGTNVKTLIELENVETPEYVTVAINDEFVDQAGFETTLLKEGDNVEFLYFMGGGSF